MATTNRRAVHRTQWIAQFAVASELCKQGYEVAFTMGNHPRKDLLVVSPGDVSFAIDVKGIYRPNWWLVTPKPPNQNLFYVFAYVPDGAPNEFFVLTQEQVNAEIAAASDAAHLKAQAKGTLSRFDEFPGVSWSAAKKYANAWKILPR